MSTCVSVIIRGHCIRWWRITGWLGMLNVYGCVLRQWYLDIIIFYRSGLITAIWRMKILFSLMILISWWIFKLMMTISYRLTDVDWWCAAIIGSSGIRWRSMCSRCWKLITRRVCGQMVIRKILWKYYFEFIYICHHSYIRWQIRVWVSGHSTMR